MLCKFWAVTTEFVLREVKSQWTLQELVSVSQSKAAPIASLNLSIIKWSMSKNKAQEQICMFWFESCAKQQI